MPSPRKTKKIAKALLRHSLDYEGRVDAEKVRDILDSFRDEPLPDYRTILKQYLVEVRRLLNSYQGVLEIAGPSQNDLPESLATRLDASLGKKLTLVTMENPDLIAGFRLRVGDDVYEDSIAQRLGNLRKSLS